jgi:hypothetical protein
VTLSAGEYCTRGKTTDCPPLSGVGVRVKRIAGIGVKVYACGLYVHPGQARKAVGDKYVVRGGWVRTNVCVRVCLDTWADDNALGSRLTPLNHLPRVLHFCHAPQCARCTCVCV